MTQELNALEQDDERATALNIDIGRIKDTLQSNIEATLYGVPLVTPQPASRTIKQTMFANPPKSLCLHISRTTSHPSGMIQKNHCQGGFSEYLDLAPYTTNGYLNTTEPTASLSSPPPTPVLPHKRTSRPSLVYLRNMANGHRFTHHQQDGFGDCFAEQQQGKSTHTKCAIFSIRPASVSGHVVTYRRKKLPTGHEVRSPLSESKPRPPTKFWRFSDEVIDEVDLETVFKNEAYPLFYERE